MTFRLVVRPEAETELEEAAKWYEAQRPGLGAEFLDTLRAQVAAIVRNPFLFPLVARAIRRARVKRFPYSIIYAVEGGDVVVLAYFHNSRDPEAWRRRR